MIASNIDALIERGRNFAAAQRDMAARATEDRTHWHHVSLADALTDLCDTLEAIAPEFDEGRADV